MVTQSLDTFFLVIEHGNGLIYLIFYWLIPFTYFLSHPHKLYKNRDIFTYIVFFFIFYLFIFFFIQCLVVEAARIPPLYSL